MVLFFPFTSWIFALVIGLVDCLIHYHIDYVKTKYGCKDIASETFWIHLGYDQMAHQLTYVLFIGLYMRYIS
jgi:hypothetical protein